MKLELIKSIDLSEYYEEFYYKESNRNNLSRREFIKYSALVSAGVLLPVNANAGCPIPTLYGKAACIAIELLHLLKDLWEIVEPFTGKIALVNNEKKVKKDSISFKLHEKEEEKILGYSEYEVPPKKYNVYGFKTIGSEKAGRFSFSANNSNSYKKVNGILVRA